MKNLVILATHPIQYQVPWFQMLSKRSDVNIRVLYSMLPDRHQQGAGFGVPLEWDIPMFEGYVWEALENKSRSPGLSHFFGTNTPGVYASLAHTRPDAVIVTGWQSLSLIQGLWACLRLNIPTIIRAESNALRKRPWWIRAISGTRIPSTHAGK